MLARMTAWVTSVTVMTPKRNGSRSLTSRSKPSTASSLTLTITSQSQCARGRCTRGWCGGAGSCGGIELFQRHGAEQDKQDKDRQFRDEEWRLGLRRRQWLQERHLLKGLHHRDEHI